MGRNVNRIVLALCLAAALASGCGLRGRLDRPVPLWGNPPSEGANDPREVKKRKDEEAAKKKQEAADKAARQQQEQQSAPTTPATPAAPAAPAPTPQ
ncbi:MAG TPA: hypothetical protein VG942_07565 [Hyphomonadaceae bacterium]|nr:hypothetical protein [Hyphomonadaceae bacterium]